LEGPLKDFDGKIIKVNKRQKCAAIKLEGEGIDKIIWLSYEYIK
jgi:transcription antitermination factor NusG